MLNNSDVSPRPVLWLAAILAVLYCGVLMGQPLDDASEAQFTELSHSLRCLVCQNQSIAESNAPLALDLRQQVREQLASGRTRDEIIDYMVVRYGDFVLYKPPFDARTLLLWVGPGVLFVLAIVWLIMMIRRRNHGVPDELTTEERAHARALLVAQSDADFDPETPK